MTDQVTALDERIPRVHDRSPRALRHPPGPGAGSVRSADRGGSYLRAAGEQSGHRSPLRGEWVEHQAVCGFVNVSGDDGAEGRIYSMSDEQRSVLVDADDPLHVSPLATMVAGIGAVIDEVADAYRSGAGVPYSHYGRHFRSGQGGINRPAFTHDLTGSWIPAAPDVHEKLLTGPAKIADVGCGQGFSTIALATAYPNATVIGIDLDGAWIEDAPRISQRARRGRPIRADRRGRSRRAWALRRGTHPRDTARSSAAGGSSRCGAQSARRRRHVVRCRRERRGEVHRAGRPPRADDVWLEHRALPSGVDGRAAVRGDRHSHPNGRCPFFAQEAGFGRFEVVDVDAGFFQVLPA